jgi:hypothetical protein
MKERQAWRDSTRTPDLLIASQLLWETFRIEADYFNSDGKCIGDLNRVI